MRSLYTILIFFTSTQLWAQSNLTEAEYFFDTDPGIGLATPVIAFAPSGAIDINELIDVSGLSIGMHTLGIRVMDENLVWSMPEFVPVFVTLSSAIVLSNLTDAEYFFDTDPGLGSAIPIPITATQNLDINELISTAALSLGMHTLNIRVQNEFNEWSIVETVPIFVTAGSALILEDIDQAEYFFDSDPGIGAGAPFVITPTSNLDINELIPTGALSIGMHTLNIRLRSDNGEWSLAETVPVYIDQNKQITQLEHFYDTDPGAGAATNLPIVPPTNSLDEIYSFSTAALPLGPHTLAVRLAGINNVWGVTEYVPFTLCSGANADFSALTTCLGDATPFTDLSINVLGGDTYAWDFDNDAIVDDVTIGSTSFTYGSTGTYNAKLEIDRGGCLSTKYVTVDVIDQPTADAGLDQSICEGSVANLSGVIGGSASTLTWTHDGTGSFDNSTILTPQYTPGPAETGVVTITLTTDDPPGTCIPVASQISLTIDPSPQVFAGFDDTICESDTYTLSASFGGSTSSILWTSSGDGGFDDNTSTTAVYTPGSADIVAGSVSLTITTDDPAGSCTAINDQIDLILDPAPSVGAGLDISFCEGEVATLNAVFGGSASSISWSTAGDGSFDDILAVNAVYTPGPADILAGGVTLNIDSDDPAGLCTFSSDNLILTINSNPSTDAGADLSICSGDIINLNGSFSGSASSALWSTAGDGNFDDLASLTAIYTPGIGDITAGTVQLTLSPDNPAGCSTTNSDQITIDFADFIAVSAGSNIEICPGDPVSLSATLTGTAATTAWSTSGSGTFDDPSLLNANYAPSPADEAAGSVTLSITATSLGTCPDVTSQLQLNIFLPITVIDNSLILDVDTSGLVDIYSGATFNPNDILQPSILQSPTKGIADLNSNGTLTYTSNSGTVGADTILFRVCNQCNQCDDGSVIVEILNVAPIINEVVSTAPPGKIVTIPIISEVTDLNDNLDFSTLEILVQPASGAIATVDAGGNITIDYTGLFFTGTDTFTIQICDFSGECTSQVITINITETDIVVYNAITPNNDGLHDYLKIQNIEFFSGNEVVIYNKIGQKVWEIKNYVNEDTNNSFRGEDSENKLLPEGTYYYLIKYNGDRKLSGFFVLGL